MASFPAITYDGERQYGGGRSHGDREHRRFTKEKKMKRATFKPLSRGRYRCNQTGEIVPKAQVHACRARFESPERTPQYEVRPAPTERPAPMRQQVRAPQFDRNWWWRV